MGSTNYRIISLREGGTWKHYYSQEDMCLYRVSKEREDTINLECIEKDCKSNGKIKNNVFMRTNNIEHNHENHQKKAEYEIEYEKLRNAVRADRRPVRDVHFEFLRTVSKEIAAELEWKKCHKTLERIRHEKFPACNSLDKLIDLLEVESTEVFKSFGYIRKERFYQGSPFDQPVFANLELIKSLPENFDLYVDGTFGILPFHERQLLVMMAEVQNRPRPIIYAIMRGQTTEHYSAIFEFVRDGIISFDGILRSPKLASSDFEQALRLALKKAWPDVELVGCWFHYCQALRTKARKCPALSGKLIDDSDHH